MEAVGSAEAPAVSATRLAFGASLAKPKSRIFAWPRVGDEDVRRLDVAMDDPLRVGSVQRIGNLDGQVEQFV